MGGGARQKNRCCLVLGAAPLSGEDRCGGCCNNGYEACDPWRVRFRACVGLRTARPGERLPRLTVLFVAMGVLFSRIWERLWSSEEFKVIVVGLDNAGKTTILYQILLNEVVVTSPTIGSNVEEVVYKNIHFVMWDIGGQDSLRSTWNTYYTNTRAVILVIDSSDRDRLAVSKEEMYHMLASEDLRKANLLIFANKQDVKGAMTAAEISEKLNLSSIKDHSWHIQPCCGLTGEGLYAGLDWITDVVKK